MFSLSEISTDNFERTAIEVFQYQASKVEVYKEYISFLKLKPAEIKSIEQIPFLPIRFFKTRKIIADGAKEEIIFTSSGTTGEITSRHYVSDLKMYEDSFLRSFRQFYGEPHGHCIIALLPSYLEREGSSLIYMCEKLINLSKHPYSGFFLHNYDDLITVLNDNELNKQNTILIGVTYALLDLAEIWKSGKLNHTVIMETGGMKGKRKEMVREELHHVLKSTFGVNAIHSEYGMTELLSQAYSTGEGIFNTPSWMKILIRDVNDPLQILNEESKTGAINIIDLANINSCSFIATDDLGKVFPDGSFEILGRMDNSDIRGCNLLII